MALGYNVMSSDLDVAFLRDPYPLLKGPLARFNLIMRQARGAHLSSFMFSGLLTPPALPGAPAAGSH